MNSKIVIVTIVLVMVSSMALACVYDSECGASGRCLNALCAGSSASNCKYDSDCGSNGRCVSDHCQNSGPIVSGCKYDSDCGSTGRCVSSQCQAGTVIVNPVCTYDSQCGATGRCVNSQCLQTAECTRHLDCLSRGLYYECSSNHCVTSSHKICRNADDCKKNVLHKKCVNDRCT